LQSKYRAYKWLPAIKPQEGADVKSQEEEAKPRKEANRQKEDKQEVVGMHEDAKPQNEANKPKEEQTSSCCCIIM
jgi:hypothetical protein